MLNAWPKGAKLVDANSVLSGPRGATVNYQLSGVLSNGLAGMQVKVSVQLTVEKFTEQKEHEGHAGCWMLVSIVIAVTNVGGLSRGEISPFPWETFRGFLARDGTWWAALVTLALVTAELWLFLIPGHLLARSLKAKRGYRQLSPYIINILVGVLLCIPWIPLSHYWHTLVNAGL